MKIGIYEKYKDGFRISDIEGDVEYSLGTSAEEIMMTLRMGTPNDGLIMFMDINDMTEFANAMRKCVDQLREDNLRRILRKEFEI